MKKPKNQPVGLLATASERLNQWFKVKQRKSTVGTEVRGGLSTFFTMAYIVVLNPLILAGAADITGRHLSIAQLTTATALVAGVMTIIMGLVGSYPFALAAGLGLNGVVAFQLASKMPWEAAMGVVVLEGLAITALVLTGYREKVFNAIPIQLKYAISVGIGLFIALIGFVDAGFIRRNPDALGTTVPLGLGIDGRLLGWPTVVFVVGLILTAVLMVKKVRGAILIGIVASTLFAVGLDAVVHVPPQFGPDGFNAHGWSLNVPKLPDKVFSAPDFGLLGHFSLKGSFVEVGVISAVLFIFTLMLADFFDTMGTVVGVGKEGDMLDKRGHLPRLKRVLLVDSLAAVAGGAASTSSNTTYIESAAGVGEGARTGLASVVTGGLFLLALFAAPLVAVVPYEAASPALVIVGFLLMSQIRNITWDDLEIAIPSFLTIILMPFTYSITNGIGAGFVSYVVLRIANGKAKRTPWLLYVIAVLFVVYFAIDLVERLLGVN